MSPEQAQGLPIDGRSDVFSFGSVLYEMFTGRTPFHGDTVSAVLTSVLVREPDLSALPRDLNPRIAVLRRCLEKNPRRRWQAVGDVRAELEAVSLPPRVSLSGAHRDQPRRRIPGVLTRRDVDRLLQHRTKG